MRHLIAILGISMLCATGCKFVAGKCDCGPAPGDNTLYAPNPPVPVSSSKPEVINGPKALPTPMAMPK